MTAMRMSMSLRVLGWVRNLSLRSLSEAIRLPAAVGEHGQYKEPRAEKQERPDLHSPQPGGHHRGRCRRKGRCQGYDRRARGSAEAGAGSECHPAIGAVLRMAALRSEEH